MKFTKSRIVSFVVTASLLAASSVYADNVCQNHYGTLQCNAGNINRINYMGMVNIDGTNVTDSCDVLGSTSISHATINDLNINGETRMSDTVVSGRMRITGRVHMRSSDIKGEGSLIGNYMGNHVTAHAPLNIVGTTECTKCTFKQAVVIVGEVNIENSEFMQGVSLSTRDAVFSGSTLADIEVKRINNTNDQTVTLKGGSRVQNITFESGKGVVYLKDGSQITGKVQGGKIVR